MPTSTIEQQVSLDEIRTFDGDALKLVEAYHAAGWTSKRSSRGHVIVYAPDGHTSASISRDSLRGRSGRNAAAPLKKWKREQEAARLAKGASFGIKDLDEATQPIEDRFPNDVPVPVLRQLRECREVNDYIDKLRRRGIDPYKRRLAVGGPAGPENYDSWFVADVATERIVGHGPGTTLEGAYDAAYASELLPRPHSQQHEQTEDDVAKGYKCEQCGEVFDRPGGLGLHTRSKHDGFVCDECGERFKAGRTLANHRSQEHGAATPAEVKKAQQERRWCADCKRAFQDARGASAHIRFVHGGRASMSDLIVQALEAQPDRRAMSVQELYDLVEPKPRNRRQFTGQLSNAGKEGRIVSAGRGKWALPGDVTVTSQDVPALEKPAPQPEPAPEPEPVTGDDTGTSPHPGSWSTDTLEALTSLPDGDTAQDMIAKIRAVVTPTVVAELSALRRERDELRHQNTLLTKQVDELNARMDILKEAMGL